MQTLVASPDSRWVATGSLDFTVILWDTADGAMVQRWVPHSYTPVRSLAFSPDSRYLVSGGDDGKAAIWDLSRGACKLATLEGHTGSILTCAWSSGGCTIATGSEDGTVRLWDPRTFRQRALIELNAAVICLAFSPDGLWLACGSRSGECCIVNVPSAVLHRSFWLSPYDGDDDGNDSFYSPQAPHRARRDAIAVFDPTSGSTRLATAVCGSSAGIKVVDAEVGSVLAHVGGKTRELPPMQDVSFSPDGTFVLGVSTETSRNAVYMWESDTGLELLRLTGHTDAVQRARFSPCGRYIASASADRTVWVWSTRNGLCVATLSEHGEAVDHVAFSPDGKTLSSGARDGTVVIRQMRDIIFTGEQGQLDAPPADTMAAAVNPDAKGKGNVRAEPKVERRTRGGQVDCHQFHCR